MKNLELLELENISGGNLWNTTGSYISYICTLVSKALSLTYPVLKNMFYSKTEHIEWIELREF